MMEVASGIVIGPLKKLAELYTPNGWRYTTAQFETDEECREWARVQRGLAIVSVGPQEAKRLGYLAEWELRVRN